MSVTGIFNGVQRIGSTAQGATDVLTRLEGGSFWAQLKPASFRGVPFVVQEGTSHFGRRNQIHEYPYRDTPWVEDLGRQARAFEVKGFLVGDDVISQRQAMIDAAERKGDGELVHPTLGKKKVALIDFMTREVWDRGRVVELTFRFIEQGQRQYPTGEKQGQATAKQTGALADLKAAAAFAKKTVSALRTGAAAANEALRQARGWATLARQVQRDATSLVNMAATLPGDFGRLMGQGGSIRTGQVLVVGGTLTLAELKVSAATSRAAVDAAGAALDTAGQALGPASTDDFAAAVQALALAVRTGAPTPGDAIRALAQLVTYSAEGSASGAALTLQAESVRLFRRAAAAQLVLAAADYEPLSDADAEAVRAIVVSALDAAISEAGDNGDDELFQALQAMKAAAVADINARGAAVPELRTVSTPASLPSLVLAYRRYGDIGREAELVARARPRHPAFMPTSFKALSE